MVILFWPGTLQALAFTPFGFQAVCNVPTLNTSSQTAVNLQFPAVSSSCDYPPAWLTNSANEELVARRVSGIGCLTGESDYPPAAAHLFP